METTCNRSAVHGYGSFAFNALCNLSPGSGHPKHAKAQAEHEGYREPGRELEMIRKATFNITRQRLATADVGVFGNKGRKSCTTSGHRCMSVFQEHAHSRLRPGKPTQIAFVDSFNGQFRESCPNQNWFNSISNARRVINEWRHHYNNDLASVGRCYVLRYAQFSKTRSPLGCPGLNPANF